MIKEAAKFALRFWVALLIATPFHVEAQTARPQRIVFLGDSITDGFGVTRAQAFPALIQAKIRQQGLPFEVVNAGLSGDTTAGGKRRIAWLLKQPLDVLVLELGGNDGLRGIETQGTEANLEAIIDAVRAANPNATVLLAQMHLPPNFSREYVEKFGSIYPAVAQEKNTILISDFLVGVGGVQKMNIDDQIHPNIEGHKILAETVWRTLEPALKARLALVAK